MPAIRSAPARVRTRAPHRAKIAPRRSAAGHRTAGPNPPERRRHAGGIDYALFGD
jgi:hypothetical protein